MNQDKKSFTKHYGDHPYPIHIIGRHVDITDAMRDYAMAKLERIAHFGFKIQDVSIAMDIQKLRHIVSYIVDIKGLKIKVTGVTDSMYSSIDLAMDRLSSKLERYHTKLTDHHNKHIKESTAPIQFVSSSFTDIINDAIEEASLQRMEKELTPHPIVQKDSYSLKTLTEGEAVMKMELTQEPFLLYRDEENLQLRLIYRRHDGNYGIIQPEK